MSELSPLDLDSERRAIDWVQDARARGLTDKEIADSRPPVVTDQVALQAARLKERLVSLYPPEGAPLWLRDTVQVVDADYESVLADFNRAVDVALNEGGPVPGIPEEMWRHWERNINQPKTSSADTNATD